MPRQLPLLAVVVAALAANVVFAQTVLFSDDMNTNAAWSIVQTADATATFGYNYSADGIPAAPRGGNTVGLKLEVNNAQPASVDHIIARHVDAAFTGQYTLRADVWLNWATDAAAAGTTEFIGLGVGHNGTTQAPNGASFLYDSDGDTTTDYRLQKNANILTTASGQYAAGIAATSNDNTDALYANAFPTIDIATAAPSQGQTGTQTAGSGGFQWMTVNVEVDTTAIGPSGATPNPGFARVSMRSASSKNSIVIGTIDNSNAGGGVAAMSGSVELLMSDVFNSVSTNAQFSFAVVDNVKVFSGMVPLPAASTADFDGDGDVDSADFLQWQRGDTPGLGSDAEFTDWKTNWPTPFPAVPAATSIPEPVAAALLFPCVVVTCLRRSRPV